MEGDERKLYRRTNFGDQKFINIPKAGEVAYHEEMKEPYRMDQKQTR